MPCAPSAASQVDLAELSNPPLPAELWLAIFDGFSYHDLHRARSINHGFNRWVLGGQFDLVLFRTPPVADRDTFFRLLKGTPKRRLVLHPIFQHLSIGGPSFANWHIRTHQAHRWGDVASRPDHVPAPQVGLADLAAMQENATYPPVLSLATLAMDLPESRAFTHITSKDRSQPVTVERVLRTLARILEERIYLPGDIPRHSLPWVQAYERSSGKISWRGEYTSPFWILTEAFEPWDGRFSVTVDKRTGDVSLIASGFRRASRPRLRLSCARS